MLTAHKLIDKARELCEGQSYAALARRLGVSPQLVHIWKVGDTPIPAARIAEIAKIARENADDWTVLIMAEQSKGLEKKTWESVIRRLGIAAAIALAIGVLPGARAAPIGKVFSEQTPDLCIMRSGRYGWHGTCWVFSFAALRTNSMHIQEAIAGTTG